MICTWTTGTLGQMTILTFECCSAEFSDRQLGLCGILGLMVTWVFTDQFQLQELPKAVRGQGAYFALRAQGLNTKQRPIHEIQDCLPVGSELSTGIDVQCRVMAKCFKIRQFNVTTTKSMTI